LFSVIFTRIYIYISGELSRSYSKEKITIILSNLQIAAVTCHALAPISPILFSGIEFELFGLQVDQYNFIGLFESGMALVLEVLVYFFFTNLTKHPGYEVYLQRIQDEKSQVDAVVSVNDETEIDSETLYKQQNSQVKLASVNKNNQIGVDNETDLGLLIQGDENVDKHQSYSKNTVKLMSLNEIFTNIDIVMILVETLLINFIVTQAELVINMVAVNDFRWSIERLSLCTVVGVLISLTLMKLLQWLKTGIDAYFLFIVCLIGNWVTLCILIFATNFLITEKILQTIVVLSVLLLNIIPGFNSAPWTLVLLFMIVLKHSRCFVGGIRQAACKVACALGFFTAAFLYSESACVYPVLAVSCFMLALFFLVRRGAFFKKYRVYEWK